MKHGILALTGVTEFTAVLNAHGVQDAVGTPTLMIKMLNNPGLSNILLELRKKS